MRTSTDPKELGVCDCCGAAAASCGECEHGPEQHDEHGHCRECERAEPDCRPCWAADAGELPRWTAPETQSRQTHPATHWNPAEYDERNYCWGCDNLDHDGEGD